MAAADQKTIEISLAAMNEAILTVMGQPDTRVQQCPLAMEKQMELIVGHEQVMLGLVLNTRRISVRIELKYQPKVLKLVDNMWHPSRNSFTIRQVQKLTGKLARLAEGAYWVYHLMSHMYTSMAFALSQSKDLLLLSSSPEYKQLLLNIQTRSFKTAHARDQDKHVRFAMKQAARQVPHSNQVFFINEIM